MAQQARRILDRIVGYQISPLLWKKVAKGPVGRARAVRGGQDHRRAGAGDTRVQGGGVLADPGGALDGPEERPRAAVERFHDAEAATQRSRPSSSRTNGWPSIRPSRRSCTRSARKVRGSHAGEGREDLAGLKNARFKIIDIKTKRTESRPGPPFITSTLQQAAANRLGFSTNRTMRIAQQLYEGIDLGSSGLVGPDHVHANGQHASCRAGDAGGAGVHRGQFGREYLPETPNFYASKKGAQEAHEAIRPTDVEGRRRRCEQVSHR